MRLTSLMCAAAMTGCALASQDVRAQSVIGQATQSAPLVTGALGARRATISAGSNVHQNEMIQTSADGRTLLQFADSTHLSVGPSASVKLDRFVYNTDATARQAVLNMTQGAFRFATGVSNPRAFRLETPHAVIGIRGTIVEFDVTRSVSNIRLLQGAITVCPRVRRTACAELVTPGQSVSATADGRLILAGGFRGPDVTREGGEGAPGGGGDGGGGRNR